MVSLLVFVVGTYLMHRAQTITAKRAVKAYLRREITLEQCRFFVKDFQG